VSSSFPPSFRDRRVPVRVISTSGAPLSPVAAPFFRPPSRLVMESDSSFERRGCSYTFRYVFPLPVCRTLLFLTAFLGVRASHSLCRTEPPRDTVAGLVRKAFLPLGTSRMCPCHLMRVGLGRFATSSAFRESSFVSLQFFVLS